MFQDYSQTQAANITVFVGFLILVLHHFNINISTDQGTFAIGVTLNFVGLVWNFVHRYQKGGVTPLGARK